MKTNLCLLVERRDHDLFLLGSKRGLVNIPFGLSDMRCMKLTFSQQAAVLLGGG